MATAYLSCLLKPLDVTTLDLIKATIPDNAQPDSVITFLQDVDSELAARQPPDNDAMDVDEHPEPFISWQDTIRAIAQTIVPLDDFQPEAPISDFKFAKQILEYLKTQLTG